MSLLSRLREKSWETPGADTPDPASYRPPASQVMMLVYFGVVTILFGLVSSAYVMRMGMHGVEHGASMSDWQAMPEPPLLWINTAVLLLASLAWEAARIAARRGHREMVGPGLAAAGALGILFLAGQVLLWGQFAERGYFLQSNPANSFFYLITTLHGLHLLGGLWFWAAAMFRLRAGGDVVLRVQLTAAYWHFLLLVWLLMLGLFVST